MKQNLQLVLWFILETKAFAAIILRCKWQSESWDIHLGLSQFDFKRAIC